jgi:hypothetical protein
MGVYHLEIDASVSGSTSAGISKTFDVTIADRCSSITITPDSSDTLFDPSFVLDSYAVD